MNAENRQKLNEFNAAKTAAFKCLDRQIVPAKLNGEPTRYYGARLNGRFFVIADSPRDIKQTATINGKPAREVFKNEFGGF